MKHALLLSTFYFAFITIGLFGIAESHMATLKVERERLQEWQRMTNRIDLVHTLFARSIVDTEELSPFSLPSGLITVATVSACNPRINPCF